MVMGIIWALAGFLLCEVLGRGKLTTTIVTAAAGAMGVGHSVLKGGGGAAPRALFWILGAAAVLFAVALFVAARQLIRPADNGPKVYVIASVRQVMADLDEQSGDPLTAFGKEARQPKRRAPLRLGRR